MIIIMMGVSGSGKTTVGQQLATDLGWLYFDGDDFHSLKNMIKMSNAIPLNDGDRSDWLLQISQHINQLVSARKSAVISCSALKQYYRRQLRIDPNVIKFVYLKGSEALIKQRLKARIGHFMKTELLASQFEALEEPKNAMIVEINRSPEQISLNIQTYFGLSEEAN